FGPLMERRGRNRRKETNRNLDYLCVLSVLCVESAGHRETKAGLDGVRRYTDRRDRLLVLLAGPDAIDLLDRQHEDLAVTYIPGAPAFDNRVHGRLDEVIGHADLEAHFL